MIKLEHIGICARNTVALKEWYVKLFGFKTVYDNKKDNPTFFLFIDSESMLEIYPMDKATESLTNKCQGIRHLAFSTDDINKEYKKLLADKVEILEDLKTNSKGVRTVFFKDLEGNILHFIQRP